MEQQRYPVLKAAEDRHRAFEYIYPGSVLHYIYIPDNRGVSCAYDFSYGHMEPRIVFDRLITQLDKLYKKNEWDFSDPHWIQWLACRGLGDRAEEKPTEHPDLNRLVEWVHKEAGASAVLMIPQHNVCQLDIHIPRQLEDPPTYGRALLRRMKKVLKGEIP
ncbi:MAG TPA: hypothetical protein VLA04_02715 [Verrucomicrobiae bacterium]|nr:hypothetical protein [Verrucomicrobiae bacterium]